jgi:hypothetical protein
MIEKIPFHIIKNAKKTVHHGLIVLVLKMKFDFVKIANQELYEQGSEGKHFIERHWSTFEPLQFDIISLVLPHGPAKFHTLI